MNTPPPFPGMVVEAAYDLLGRASATVSINRMYRYSLTRTVNPQPAGVQRRDIVWVMLNPSTADAMVDDPTIRRCQGFSRRVGAGLMHIVNLYALRATDPKQLTHHVDPIGEWNDQVVDWVIADAHQPVIVAAWGAHSIVEHRAAAVLGRVTAGHDMYCLGVTKHGQPRHPLYVGSEKPLRLYRPRVGANPGESVAASR